MTFAQNLRGHAAGIGVVPQSLASGASTGVFAKWATTGRSLGVVAFAGAIASGGSVVIKLQQASDSSATGAADVAGFTQLITYNDTEDNLVKVAEIPAATLASLSASAKPYLALIATTASATVLVSAAVVVLDPNYSV